MNVLILTSLVNDWCGSFLRTCSAFGCMRRPYHATWGRSRRLPFLLTDDPVQQFRVFFDRRGEVAAPFPPGPRVISDLLVADQLQDDIEPGRAHAPRAIADHLMAGMEALLVEPRTNL